MELGKKIRSSKFFILLCSLLALLLVLPFMNHETMAGRVVLNLLLTGLLLSAVYAASGSRRRFIVATCLAIPWLFVSWGRDYIPIPEPDAVAAGLLVVLCVFTLGIMLARIIGEEDVDFDTICAAISVYLLMGVSWTITYVIIETLSPGSFSIEISNIRSNWIDLLYFSFTTITTLGYGDISPVHPVARAWSTLEAVTGTLYIALLIARLVSLYRR